MNKLTVPLEEVIKMDKEQRGPRLSENAMNVESSGKDFTKVFVGNLSYQTSWQDLKDYMKTAGDVLYADVFMDSYGKSKGCGVVEFSSNEAAQNAIQLLNETEFKGRKIFLKESNENRSHNKGEKFEKFPRKEFPRKEFNNKDRFHGNDNFRSSDKYRDRDEEYEKERSRSRSKENYERKPVHFNKNPKFHEEKKYYAQPYERRESSRKRSDKGGNFQEGYKLYVQNLPYSCSWQNLKDAFKAHGEVVRADIKTDFSGKSQGSGFVIFNDQEEAENAIQNMDKTMFNGREITVRFWN